MILLDSTNADYFPTQSKPQADVWFDRPLTVNRKTMQRMDNIWLFIEHHRKYIGSTLYTE